MREQVRGWMMELAGDAGDNGFCPWVRGAEGSTQNLRICSLRIWGKKITHSVHFIKTSGWGGD